MSFEQILFYLFSTILVLGATAVVTVRNPVHAAMFLVLCFVTTSALWLLLEAEFLAITLVLVYVGAVMVLFLFVVMMLDINIARMRDGFARYLPVGIVVAGVAIGTIVMAIWQTNFGHSDPVARGADYSNTRELGEQLYTTYVYPFELASVVLLVAIVAAIALTLRSRAGTRYQKIEEQVVVKKADRLRIVQVEAEERK
ncbi:MAG: NADH-quinone oxidoreductase subunit J [Chromatiales bacterium]|nr:NADH-quinone oxidoreductase subunit J [Chromatiales bacterium]